MNLSAEIFSFTLLFPFRVHYYFFNKKRFDLKHSRDELSLNRFLFAFRVCIMNFLVRKIANFHACALSSFKIKTFPSTFLNYKNINFLSCKLHFLASKIYFYSKK